MVALICKEEFGGEVLIGNFSKKIESKEFDAEKDIYFYGATFYPSKGDFGFSVDGSTMLTKKDFFEQVKEVKKVADVWGGI